MREGPPVLLGAVGADSVAPTVFGLVDRGRQLRPQVAAEMAGRIRLRFAEGYPDVLIDCGSRAITVGDDDGGDPDLEVNASLPDLAALVTAPLARGVPKPTHRRGRAALLRLADGRVEMRGSLKLGRRLLRLLTVAPPD